MVRTRPWDVSDALWERVEPLVPPEPPKPKGGRPRMADRKVFAAIVYVLRTGIQWNALPREMGASSTVHARFQEWVRAGFFGRLHAAGLTEYDALAGVDWAWQAADGAMEGATGPKRRYRRRGGAEPDRPGEAGDEA